MWEDIPSLISSMFQSSCEQLSNWQRLNYNFLAREIKEEVVKDGDGETVDPGNKRKSNEQQETPEIKAVDRLVNSSDNHRDDKDRYSGATIDPLGIDLTMKCLLLVARSDLGTVASLNHGFRQLIRSGELYRLRYQKEIIEHWVYISVHFHEWQAYDPYSQRWIMLPRSFGFQRVGSSLLQPVGVGTDLLIFGTEHNFYTVVRYSTLTNNWSIGTVMNSPRCMFGAASIGWKAIIAGGIHGASSILRSAELYDCVSQTWETLPSMNRARMKCSAVFMDGKFYVFGGLGTEKEVLNCGEVYDLERRSWTLIPEMCAGLASRYCQPPRLAVVNNQLYAIHEAECKLKKYDKIANSWITLGSLPGRCTSANVSGIAFLACGERLMIIGGGGVGASDGGTIELNSWIPNDCPPEWTVIARRHCRRTGFTFAVLGC